MPVVRLCPHCRKSFLKSTYQMIEHATKCNPNGYVTISCKKNTSVIQTEGIKNNLEKISKKQFPSFLPPSS